jgi:hypothetical protein
VPRARERGLARPRGAARAAFVERFGAGAGPTRKAPLFFYLDEYVKDAPRDLLGGGWRPPRMAGAASRRNRRWCRRTSTRSAGLLQLNPAERALLLYGTLARYQRDLRGCWSSFKVCSAQEALCGDRPRWPRVDEREFARGAAPGSRLERIGMVENLISEHNITDLADLMKVSEQMPPVLMREYRGPPT